MPNKKFDDVNKKTDLDRLKRALRLVAELVVLNPDFTPVFRRLESEISAITAERDAIKRAQSLLSDQSAIDAIASNSSVKVDLPYIS